MIKFQDYRTTTKHINISCWTKALTGRTESRTVKGFLPFLTLQLMLANARVFASFNKWSKLVCISSSSAEVAFCQIKHCIVKSQTQESSNDIPQ